MFGGCIKTSEHINYALPIVPIFTREIPNLFLFSIAMKKENKQELNEQKEQEPDIVCMTGSIKIFRLYGVFPPKGKLLNTGKLFYFKFIITALVSSITLDGSLLHLIKNIKGM